MGPDGAHRWRRAHREHPPGIRPGGVQEILVRLVRVCPPLRPTHRLAAALQPRERVGDPRLRRVRRAGTDRGGNGPQDRSGAEVRRKEAAPLSSILDAFLESLRIPHVAFLVSLRKRWPEIAGPLVSRNAIPLSLRNGVLTVVVRNHAWAQELRMSKIPMIGRIREAVGERIPVGDIRFTVGSLASVEEEEAVPLDEPPHPAGPDPEGLSAVADPETRER